MECLEGRFDTFGTFGRDFTGNLTLGGEASMHHAWSFGVHMHPFVILQLCQQQQQFAM